MRRWALQLVSVVVYNPHAIKVMFLGSDNKRKVASGDNGGILLSEKLNTQLSDSL